MKRPNNCSRCGVDCTPVGHHADYDRPKDVVWLCRKCHRKEHLLNGKGKNWEKLKSQPNIGLFSSVSLSKVDIELATKTAIEKSKTTGKIWTLSATIGEAIKRYAGEYLSPNQVYDK